jgi:hypothetical protein
MSSAAVPVNVVAQQGNGQVLLTWNTVVGATSYQIQRSTDNITFTNLASVTTPQYLDLAVTVGTQYFYQIASNNGTLSAYSSPPVSAVPTESGQMTLGQLRLLAQQKADRVNSNFVLPAEWNVYINQSYFELYDLLVQKYGNEYFVAPETRFTLTGTNTYALPNGLTTFQDLNNNNIIAPPFYKLLGLDLAVNAANNAWLTLNKYMFIRRNTYVYPQITTQLLGIASLQYRIIGNNIVFIPTPQANQIARIWYIPRLTTLLKDTDIADGVSGWLEYVAVDAAIKALQKEESDVTVLMAQKMALIDRIEAAAENRDAGIPEKISDTRMATDLYGQGFPFGGQPFGGF